MTSRNLKNMKHWSSLVAHQVKDPVLSLLWLWLQLWCGFNPWPRNFYMPWAWPKKKKKNTKPKTKPLMPVNWAVERVNDAVLWNLPTHIYLRKA